MAAAASSIATIRESPLSNNDRKADRGTELPSGRCNFTELSLGGGRCGCLRYWDRTQYGDASAVGFCMCNHHACFHEAGDIPRSSQTQLVVTSTVPEKSIWSSRTEEQVNASLAKPIEDHPNSGTNNTGQYGDDNLPDTEQFAMLTRPSQMDGQPPLPAECLLPADLSSGIISGDSQAFLALYEEHRAALEAADHSPDEKAIVLHSDRRDIDTNMDTDMDCASATHENTPRTKSPELGMTHFSDHVKQLHQEVGLLAVSSEAPKKVDIHSGQMKLQPETGDKQRKDIPIRRIIPHLDTILKHVTAFPTLTVTAENHSRRIDILENASFSNIAIDELKDSTEAMDEHIREVEGKLEDLVKTVASFSDGASITSLRRGPRLLDDRSMTSDTSSAMISSAIEHSEINSRLDALETQIAEIRAAANPSHSRPWEVEVIYLPFGHELRGLWFSLDQFPSQRSRNNSMAADDWTQTQFTALAKEQAKLVDDDATRRSWEDVLGDDNCSPFVARACRIGSKVEERLRSRGLIRHIQVRGPDAKDVQAAMVASFGDTLSAMEDAGSSSQGMTTHTNGYHGLQAQWIPLRKLHKDSRLRLLDPAEMITPALWTVSFLASSVAMRAADNRRLYVTHRDAYMQGASGSSNWSWQKLRAMPNVYGEAKSSLDIGRAESSERCWAHDTRLDPPPSLPPSLHSSFDSQSHHSNLSIRPSVFAQYDSSSSSGGSTRQTNTPTSTKAPHLGTLLAFADTRSSPSRPLHGRTTSMPLMPLPITTSLPPTTKRRIASFDHEELQLPAPHFHSSPGYPPGTSPTRPNPIFIAKRQRVSRSPSRPRDTPRWSDGAPSPFVFEDATAGHDQPKRGITPLAYATPHSNYTPYHEVRGGYGNDDNVFDDDNDNGTTTDELELDGQEFDIYENDSTNNDDNNDSQDEMGSQHFVQQGIGQQGEDHDEIWPGIEDNESSNNLSQEKRDSFGAEQNALSPEENENAIDDDDNMSGVSSGPSEYPSKQPIRCYEDRKAGFVIHVDEEEQEPGAAAALGY